LINITHKRQKESVRIRDKYPDRIPVRHVQQFVYVKDLLGDQRGGGSEWEPIKILLEGD
jgi:hypothetical protein